jgi:hypothetical protein
MFIKDQQGNGQRAETYSQGRRVTRRPEKIHQQRNGGGRGDRT